MIKKNEEQFDGGGVILKHIFLLGFNGPKIPTEDITEDMVDEYVKEKSLDFEWEFKSFLMMELGYIGKEGDVWIKEPVVSCSYIDKLGNDELKQREIDRKWAEDRNIL